jgi:predicted dehydrogenase
MSKHNRRQFLQRAAAAGVGAAAFSISGTKAAGRVPGANGRVRVAVAGVNNRGQEHLAAYAKLKDKVEIAYLVDPDGRLFEQKSKWVKDNTGDSPKCEKDLRKVLEDKDVDAVSIASPNHWHALQAIWSIQAGKDVYVEKPCSHNIHEGRRLVEVAEKSDRIVQHGTQTRSNPAYMAEIAALQSGKYGKLLVAYGFANKPRPSIGFKPLGEPPKELDFDVWVGPAPMQPYHDNLVPYKWHWFWDFGNGEIGNQGVHQMDIARWAMHDDAEPKSVVSLGGRYGQKDQGQTPNTLLSVFDFGEAKLVFEVRGLVDGKHSKVCNEFYTTEGAIREGLFFPRGKTKGELLPDVDPEAITGRVTLSGKAVRPWSGKAFQDAQQLHFNNFIDCVISRKRKDIRSQIIDGHRSAILSHIANISYRLGAESPILDPVSRLGGDASAHEAFGAMKQHLADAGVKLDDTLCCIGRKLQFDAKAERFPDAEEANKMLTRAYRAPFLLT